MTTARKRYPGPQPFSPEDKDLFFGRDKDVETLKQMINLRPITTLHGQSGLGKTSLLNTKVLPHFEESGYQIIRVRFGNYQGADSPFPPSTLANSLPEAALQESFHHKIESEYPSLWQQCKTLQITETQAGRNFAGILFVFDQFEELFTYPKGADMVANQLEKLLNDRQPRPFQRKKSQVLRSNPNLLSKEEWELLESPLTVKILFSLRSDRMSLLDRLSDQLPSILRYCYELQAFTEDQARDAIVQPAALDQAGFASPAFAYSEEAVNHLISFLTNNGTQSVDPFQIQLICPNIEERVLASPPAADGSALPTVQKEALPELTDLYTDYYLSSLSKLPEDRQKPSRLLIEEGLILPDVQRRISVDGRQLISQFKVDEELLRALVDQRLLRSDRNQHGAYNYEVSHDSLVVPILQQRKERVEKESLNAYFKKVGLYSVIALGVFILGFSIWVVRLNSQLTDINRQLLSAFNQMGWTFSDENALKGETPMLRTIDLTNEIGSARQALISAQKKLSNFQSKTRELEAKLDSGKITQEEYIRFFQENQAELSELLNVPGIAQMANSNEFLPRPDTSAVEIRARVNRFYLEAARLGEQKKYGDAIHKYEQILHWFPREKRAQDSVAAIRRRLNPNQGSSSSSPFVAKVDTDKDGVPDNLDKCATVFGLKELAGCPDQDGDGIPDNEDNCPEKPGTKEYNGCSPEEMKVDTDKDGIADAEDHCKDLFGTAALQGCPDGDEDGVADPDDMCPEEPGDPELQGCPDPDGDKVVGELDKCPDEAGSPELGGCPDNDGDGLVGEDDQCPDQAGLASNNGCPPEFVNQDPDKDGILADQDSCPEQRGLPVFNGCLPPVKLPEVERVPAGFYTRVNEFNENAHTVTLPGFEIGKYEISWAEYYPFLLSTVRLPSLNELFSKDLDYFQQPAVGISWNQARKFCQWLSEQDPDHNYRLPTEAEWEFAAKGGVDDTTPYSGSSNPDEVAIYNKFGSANYQVGTLNPNALGIYNMSGGVAEWCNDWFVAPDPNNKKDAFFPLLGDTISNPQGPQNSPDGRRSVRGGSFQNVPKFCRIIEQNGAKPNTINLSYGIRIVRY